MSYVNILMGKGAIIKIEMLKMRKRLEKKVQ